MRKYYSDYTGKQIDEAVGAIIENKVSIEDLSPELVATIKGWIAEGAGAEEARELVFQTHYDFPSVGDSSKLYIATDENRAYYWSDKTLTYTALQSPTPDVINGGGAKE